LLIDGEVVVVVAVEELPNGLNLVVRTPTRGYRDALVSFEALPALRLAASDGGGRSAPAIAALWALWMQREIPRIRSAVMATRPLWAFAHQDEAVFDAMLPEARLRFLLADEPGTGKTIMAGMYMAEARRRNLLPGRTILVVPAHIVTKWIRDLERFFGIQAIQITSEIGREPLDLRSDVDVWITSVDLYTYNDDVRRKVAGTRASWSLALFDEAHRLTPTSQYLGAARQLADKAHHLLLLTATPHRGKEHFFRALGGTACGRRANRVFAAPVGPNVTTDDFPDGSLRQLAVANDSAAYAAAMSRISTAANSVNSRSSWGNLTSQTRAQASSDDAAIG
jgi:SNF2 family DNA or RNA helicase